MFGFARTLSAAILVIAAAGCSADPAAFFGDTTQSTQSKGPKPSRVAAERVAAAAKAAAEAEAAANPLVRIFGSQAQREAEAAQAYLDQIVADTTARPKSTAKAPGPAKTAKTLAKPTMTARTVEGQGKPGTHATVQARPRGVPASVKGPVASKPQPEPAKAASAATPPRAASEVIVYDVVAGIKTVHRANGTVEEEAFDPATLPAIKAARHSGKARIRIVNEANPASTGSTVNPQAHEPSPAIKAGPR